jgi:hypothetical protein
VSYRVLRVFLMIVDGVHVGQFVNHLCDQSLCDQSLCDMTLGVVNHFLSCVASSAGKRE